MSNNERNIPKIVLSNILYMLDTVKEFEGSEYKLNIETQIENSKELQEDYKKITILELRLDCVSSLVAACNTVLFDLIHSQMIRIEKKYGEYGELGIIKVELINADGISVHHIDIDHKRIFEEIKGELYIMDDSSIKESMGILKKEILDKIKSKEFNIILKDFEDQIIDTFNNDCFEFDEKTYLEKYMFKPIIIFIEEHVPFRTHKFSTTKHILDSDTLKFKKFQTEEMFKGLMKNIKKEVDINKSEEACGHFSTKIKTGDYNFETKSIVRKFVYSSINKDLFAKFTPTESNDMKHKFLNTKGPFEVKLPSRFTNFVIQNAIERADINVFMIELMGILVGTISEIWDQYKSIPALLNKRLISMVIISDENNKISTYLNLNNSFLLKDIYHFLLDNAFDPKKMVFEFKLLNSVEEDGKTYSAEIYTIKNSKIKSRDSDGDYENYEPVKTTENESVQEKLTLDGQMENVTVKAIDTILGSINPSHFSKSRKFRLLHDFTRQSMAKTRMSSTEAFDNMNQALGAVTIEIKDHMYVMKLGIDHVEPLIIQLADVKVADVKDVYHSYKNQNIEFLNFMSRFLPVYYYLYFRYEDFDSIKVHLHEENKADRNLITTINDSVFWKIQYWFNKYHLREDLDIKLCVDIIMQYHDEHIIKKDGINYRIITE